MLQLRIEIVELGEARDHEELRRMPCSSLSIPQPCCQGFANSHVKKTAGLWWLIYHGKAPLLVRNWMVYKQGVGGLLSRWNIVTVLSTMPDGAFNNRSLQKKKLLPVQ